MRRQTIETAGFGIMPSSISCAAAVWLWGMVRKSFGAIPAILWVVLIGTSLICAAIVGVLEFRQ